MQIKLFNLLAVALLGCAALLSSCKKEESPVAQVVDNHDDVATLGVWQQDGMLHFANIDAFYATVDRVVNLPSDERRQWEQALGFTSMASEIELILEEASLSDEEFIEEELATVHANLVRIVDDVLEPIVNIKSFQVVANGDGFYNVGGTLHKVTENEVITCDLGTQEPIDNYLKNKGRTAKTKGVNVFPYKHDAINLGSKYGGCGDRITGFNNTSDRKCDIVITVSSHPVNCCYDREDRYTVELNIRNYKKNWLGRWKSYKSGCYCRNVMFTVQAPVVTGYNGVHSLFSYKPLTMSIPHGQSNGGYESYTWSWVIGDRTENVTLKTPSFDRVKAEAKNAGMSQKDWAKLICGSW